MAAGGGRGLAGLALTVSPGFLLLAASVYFVGGPGALAAFGAAALIHELGHLTAMFLTGATVRGIRVSACGPVIDYSGVTTRRQEMGILAAGPLAAIFFAVLCFITDVPFLCYTGAIALLAAMFNLLPVLPMDGGRLALYALETTMSERSAQLILRIMGTLCSLGVLATGIYIRSIAAAAAGIWMGMLANFPQLR